MRATVRRETLQNFYERVFATPRPVRVGSMAGIAVLTALMNVWPPAAATLWLAAYLVTEFGLVWWWRKVLPTLAQADDAQVARREIELIAVCATSCAICALPCLATPLQGRDNQILGVILSAGVLLVAGAEHSLRRNMFLATAPLATVAFLWNLFALGRGPTAWLFLSLGAFYVANARTLQVSNAKVFQSLVRLRADAEAANTAKSEFLATMSHEIRTPLNGVLGMTQVLMAQNLARPHQEKLQVIAESGQALLGVLNAVLDISKMESGRLELEQHPFDLADVVRQTAAPFDALAREKRLDFRIEVAEAAWGAWRGDATRLGQVLTNLLSNALKFTETGSITLAVAPAPEGLAFSVSDTGIGVPPEKLELIFETFTQADASTTRRFGGTGLGLAICRRFVALMGGELRLESHEGAGSRFSFSLPLERTVVAGAPAPAAAPPPVDRPLRILAAEDNPTNQMILKALLATLEVDLTVVGDGRAAVAALGDAGEFDLVLMDVQMPVMDGMAATAEIRRRERATGRHTPIVALTANALRSQVDTYLAAGFDAHVAKPIQFSELVAAIEAAVAPAANAMAL